jgi:hypothetical protein
VFDNAVDGGFDSQVWESFLEFDTLLQPGRSFSTATLSLYITTDSATSSNFTINVALKNFGTGVDIGDFVAGGSLSASPITTLSTFFTSSGNSSSAGADIAANLTTSGKTQFILYSNKTQNNTAPPTNVSEYVVINPSNCRLNVEVV